MDTQRDHVTRDECEESHRRDRISIDTRELQGTISTMRVKYGKSI